MEKLSKIDVKLIEYNKILNDSNIDLKVKGKNIDHIIMNTIRRSVLTNVPIYAFKNIVITENTSIFNNNYLKVRLENMPVFGISNDYDFLPESKEEDDEDNFEENINQIIQDNIDINVDENIDNLNLNQLTMYVQYENKSKDECLTVSTDDAIFYVSEKKIKSPYPNPIPIIKLNPGEKITFSAITELNIEEHSAIYSPVSVITCLENAVNDYNLKLESRGQISEKRILIVAIKNILKMIDDFISLVPDKNNGMEGILKIMDGGHTIGNLISSTMRKHKLVSFCGYNLPHPLDNKVNISYKIESGKLKNILNEVVKYNINIFSDILKSVQKIK
jgi:DNA-directed RNA polymerase subunit L